MSNDPPIPIDPRAAAVSTAFHAAAEALRDLGLRATVHLDPLDGVAIRFAEAPLSHHAAMRRAVIPQRLADALANLLPDPALPALSMPAGPRTGRPTTLSAFGCQIDLPRRQIASAVARVLRLESVGLQPPPDDDWGAQPTWRISHRHRGAALWVAKQVKAPDVAAAIRRTLWKDALATHLRGDPPIDLGAAASLQPGGWDPADDLITATEALRVLAGTGAPLDRMLVGALTLPTPP